MAARLSNAAAFAVALELAAVNLLRIGLLLKQPEVRARSRVIAESELPPGRIDEIELGARALLHLLPQYRAAEAGATEVKLPVALAEEVTALRAAMLDLVTYHFRSRPLHGPEVAAVRLGSGYLDAGQDLDRLANLHDAERAVVSRDAYALGRAPAARSGMSSGSAPTDEAPVS